MNTTSKVRIAGGLLLLFTGCVGPVEIAPLPYAHPANPDAPAGAMPAVGSMLNSPPEGIGEDKGTGMSHDHKSGETGPSQGQHECLER